MNLNPHPLAYALTSQALNHWATHVDVHTNLLIPLFPSSVPHCRVEDESPREETACATGETWRGSCQGSQRITEEGAKPNQSSERIPESNRICVEWWSTSTIHGAVDKIWIGKSFGRYRSLVHSNHQWVGLIKSNTVQNQNYNTNLLIHPTIILSRYHYVHLYLF